MYKANVSSVPVAGGVQASAYSAPVKPVSGETRTCQASVG